MRILLNHYDCLAVLCAIVVCATSVGPQSRAGETDSRFVYDRGAITRGDPTTKKLALVFTGDEFADGANTIAGTLKSQGVHGSFFFTGRFYRNPQFESAIRRLKRDGHYLGAHSDAHVLYCDWSDRDKLLISRKEFEQDLNRNYASMRVFGISKTDARYFLPPFEWYNQNISDWTVALNLQLINFTSGTRSNADYTTPEMKTYVNSKAILESIKQYEAKDPVGLNGFILLLHVGVAPARTDKFYEYLKELIEWLKSKNYELVRIDELLGAAPSHIPKPGKLNAEGQRLS